jgi:hypothetical protein
MLRQLSFDVAPHPHAAARPDGGWMDGSLKITGAFGVQDDLNPGDEITVTVANADGEVIATGVAEIAGVAFAPIKLDGAVVGTERVHRAKLA